MLSHSTGDDGSYSISLPSGTYTVRVARIGFAPDSMIGVFVAPGQTVTASFQLRATATTLTGVVSVGYGTLEHQEGLRVHGPTRHHRFEVLASEKEVFNGSSLEQ